MYNVVFVVFCYLFAIFIEIKFQKGLPKTPELFKCVPNLLYTSIVNCLDSETM